MSRSELKAQDEITSTLGRLTETAINRKKEVLIGAVLLLGIAGVLYGWRTYSSGRDSGAQMQLGTVISAFHNPTVKVDKERFEKTIAEAQKTMSAYPSSHAGSMAQYYMALSQDGLGDQANAVKNLEEVIGRGDTEVKPVAQFALAALYKRHGEFQKAIDVLKQLDAAGTYSKSAVAFELGSTAEAAKQKDVAQEAYSKVIKDSPDSPFRADAEAALKRMGLPIPAPTPEQVEVK
jgi:predicted negative regulator of RcsB-dependent stress response